MSRTPQQVIAQMATAAALTDFSPEFTWRDALFQDTDGTWALSSPGDPDRALLASVAAQHAQLDAHADSLPNTLHLSWLTDLLRITRLPSVPDKVVANATVTPALAPAVIPAGTLLRGGKDAYGNERRYRTLDTLTAHGAQLVAVRVTVPGGPLDPAPGRALEATPTSGFPVEPNAGSPDGPLAGHVLRISSPLLAFTSGKLIAEFRFTLSTPSLATAPVPAGVKWRYPRADGTMSDDIGHTALSDGVSVLLNDGCVDPGGGEPWVEMFVPHDVAVPDSFAFDSVTVTAKRTGIAPDAGFYNDGAVDITKEFKPFGAVARRGDSFYLRSDEAFTKPLANATIAISTLAPDGTTILGSTYGYGMLTWYSNAVTNWWTAAHGSTIGYLVNVVDYFGGSNTPSVQWQRRANGGWLPFGEPGPDFDGVDNASMGDGPGSEAYAVSGQEGHYVRAFLSQGDFGWSQYQNDLADFATAAVKHVDIPDMPKPPDALLATSITLSYTTRAQAASRVVATNGWHKRQLGSAPLRPFVLTVADDGTNGEVAIGVTVPEAALGSTVSLYVELDSAAPCGMTDDEATTWQWWDGVAWQPLATADGTLQLRESGLVRFVAPLAWAEGCSDLGAALGRWIRMTTGTATRLGTLRAVIPDAVLAEYVSSSIDPALDPSGDIALPPGTIKGTLAPIRGVKKVTNLASVRGRAPERDEQYAMRASALVRHRGRALTAWDYEQHVTTAFPEVAAVRCLPHTGSDGLRAPGRVGLVLLPDRPLEAMPRPSVSLTRRVGATLAPLMPMGAKLAVLCPLFVPVSITASVLLTPKIAAIDGRVAVLTALEALLHPGSSRPERWGVTLYASTLIAALERMPMVDRVTSFAMLSGGSEVPHVDVDACRGLYCSAGSHFLTCEEQL